MVTLPNPPLLSGVDRAEPFTNDEVPYLPEVVAYYLPSSYAAVRWTIEQARKIPLERYVLPIYVAPLALSAGDGIRAAIAAVAQLHAGYPDHGVLALDIEQRSVPAEMYGGTVTALDIQGQVANEFLNEIYTSTDDLVPIVYGSPALWERIVSNFWLADWLEIAPDAIEDDERFPLLRDDGKVPPVGWQFAGNVNDGHLGVVDRSYWSPFLFNSQVLGVNVLTHTTIEGDTLEGVAVKYYKTKGMATMLYGANIRKLRRYGIGALPPGLTLNLPGATVDITPAVDTAKNVETAASQTPVIEVEKTDASATNLVAADAAADSPLTRAAKALLYIDELTQDEAEKVLTTLKEWWKS